MDLVRKQRKQDVLPPVFFIGPSFLCRWICQICNKPFPKLQRSRIIVLTVKKVTFFFFQRGYFLCIASVSIKLIHIRSCDYKTFLSHSNLIKYSILPENLLKTIQGESNILSFFLSFFPPFFPFPVFLFFCNLGDNRTSPE